MTQHDIRNWEKYNFISITITETHKNINLISHQLLLIATLSPSFNNIIVMVFFFYFMEKYTRITSEEQHENMNDYLALFFAILRLKRCAHATLI